MASLKLLAKDTAIYGLSSIVGRFLNYLLVPLYTASIPAASGGYGVITNVYALTALTLVILTFGMETTFFRFVNKEGENAPRVYTTALIAVGLFALAFLAAVLGALPSVSSFLGYADHPSYVACMAVVVAMDAFQAIPFAYLRYKRRPWRFAFLKLLFIALNILINVVYFLVLPALYKHYPDAIGKIYDPNVSQGYAFYINLVCTSIVMLFMLPELRVAKWVLDTSLLKRMLNYSWPLVILGIAGILNQTADKILFPQILKPASEAQVQLGIYGAATKVAMIMAMLTQAFRYAYEPLVFSKSQDKDSGETYALGMKWFIIGTLIAFMMVMAWMDIIERIILPNPDYREGLRVVPIVMAAEIMMGVYFNLSFWYKLTDHNLWGAVFSGIGCAVLIAINVIFVPRYGYIACAWGGVAGYGVSMILSYIVGQHYYPIAYPLRDIALYVLLTAVLFAASQVPVDNALLRIAYRTFLLALLVGVVMRRENLLDPIRKKLARRR